jgi:hypothetical protein
VLVRQAVHLERPPTRDEVRRWRDDVDEFGDPDRYPSGGVRQNEEIMAYRKNPTRVHKTFECVSDPLVTQSLFHGGQVD